MKTAAPYIAMQGLWNLIACFKNLIYAAGQLLFIIANAS